MVGCVIVHNGLIIGEGYHHEFGGPHAEVEAIRNVKDKTLLPDSILYVSLEPCCHHGKTPPCSDLIISSGIKKVVTGAADPNPCVAGKGIQHMRSHGIEVLSGVLDQECRHVNRRFMCFHNEKRP
jgi:diaminohydroxyphosphoribosylaminopyrimidine deaminase/5-amino-6-(5-phosphoribosylamino)uracil reductase